MSLEQLIFVFSNPGKFLADSNVHVDSNTVEFELVYMVDPFLSVVWEMLGVGSGGREYESFPVESFPIQNWHPIEIVQELSVQLKTWEAQGKAADNALFVWINVSGRLDELSEQLILLTFFAFFKVYVNITEATVSPVCQGRTTYFSKTFHPLLFFI